MAGLAGLGGFAQGMTQGLNNGIQMGKAAQEREKYQLERPILQANAQKAEQEMTFQQDYAERLKQIYAEGAGGEVQNEDGTVTTKPPLDPITMELRASDAMKQSMFKAGINDIKRLKEAREYSKMIEEEGVMDAMQYALKNPNDQAGIRERFNANGKIKLGEDVTIGIEQGDFGPKVVGYKVGADGKQVKAFDGSDLLKPYVSAQTLAQIEAQKDITSVKERGDDRRTALTTGATIEAARLRETAADKRQRAMDDRQDKRDQNAFDRQSRAEAAKQLRDDIQSIQTGVTADIGAALRNSMNSIDSDRTIIINREAAALAESLYRDDPHYRNRPNAARADASAAVLKKYGISTDPTFVKPNPPKK
jgi:hypothetical protein